MQEAKRRRTNPIETHHTDTSIDTLNDDCILKIFEWLELDTLCIVGDTCKKLKRLVTSFFQRKYPNKIMSEVRIQVAFDGRIVLSPPEQYVKCFLKFMQNITLGGGYQKRPLDVSAFIQKNCKNNIRQIAFEEVKFNKLHGALIIDWLKTIESVAFFSCQNVHRILKYCDNLKNLKIDNKYSKDESNIWMTKKYLKLEHLQYDLMLRDQSSNKKMLIFLKNHSNIKSLMFEFDIFSQRFAEEIMLDLSTKDLDELLLTFNDFSYLASKGDLLEEICKRGLNRLQLCFQKPLFPYSYTKYLNKLKCLEGLHVPHLPGNLHQNMPLEHLKILRIEYACYVSTDIISKNLPNLEELYVMSLESNLKEFVAPFVRNAVKLNKIVARDIKIRNRMEMTNYRLVFNEYFKYFNDERGQLLDPCKVIIYIGKDAFDASFNTMPSKFDLVELRQVEFQIFAVDVD